MKQVAHSSHFQFTSQKLQISSYQGALDNVQWYLNRFRKMQLVRLFLHTRKIREIKKFYHFCVEICFFLLLVLTTKLLK